MCKITVEYHIHVDLAQLIGIMELTYELVKHLIQNRKRRQINACYYLLTQGSIVPGNESSFHWNFRSWNFRSQERKFQGATVPESESSLSESSKNFRSRERMFQGAKVPESESSWNFRSQERKFHTMVLSLPGAKVLRSESSCYPKFGLGAEI